jgi:hypothetical protein
MGLNIFNYRTLVVRIKDPQRLQDYDAPIRREDELGHTNGWGRLNEKGARELTTETRIKMSDMLVGAFLLVLFTLVLTIVVFYALITLFPFDQTGAILGGLSLIVSLEVIEIIFIVFLIYRRPVERVR